MLMEYLEASVNPEHEMELIDLRHQEYCEYWRYRRDADGIDAPKLDTWVREKGWLDPPPPRKRAKKSAIEEAFERA
jgi:hypothetical protein